MATGIEAAVDLLEKDDELWAGVLTATPWPAERFATLGLVSRLVPAGTALTEAVALARTICTNAPLAVRGARRAILAARDLDEPDRWDLAERELAALQHTDDYREGPRSFAEKRAPHWTGR
jgi:enoyl-CoA hydratase/carnithine racemase